MTIYDHVLDEFESKVSVLTRPQKAAFFAGCGESLLADYEVFRDECEWGNTQALHDGLSLAWNYAKTGKGQDVGKIISELEMATPHADDFDSPYCKYAQDAVICVDAAVRASSSVHQAEEAWVEYALEPIKTAICLDEFGLLDVGSDNQGEAWLNELVKKGLMKEAISGCLEAIAFIGRKPLLVDSDVRWIVDRLNVLSPSRQQQA